MSDLKPQGTPIRLGKNDYGLRFTLNAIEDIQDHFDIPISKLTDLFNDERKQISNVKYLITLLINENIDYLNDENETKIEHIDARYLGRQIDAPNIMSMIDAILLSFTGSLPEGEEDESPNEMSEQ